MIAETLGIAAVIGIVGYVAQRYRPRKVFNLVIVNKRIERYLSTRYRGAIVTQNKYQRVVCAQNALGDVNGRMPLDQAINILAEDAADRVCKFKRDYLKAAHGLKDPYACQDKTIDEWRTEFSEWQKAVADLHSASIFQN